VTLLTLILQLLAPLGCTPADALLMAEAAARPYPPPPPPDQGRERGPTPGGERRGRGPQKAAVGTFELEPCTVSPDALPEAPAVSITELVGALQIESNGIPDHPVGRFPNAGNPHTITAQDHHFTVSTEPSGQGGAMELGRIGVAINGVPFDPGAAEWWGDDMRSGWQYEALSGAIGLGLDCNHAHVQPDGSYHYHGLPVGLVGEGMTHVGYAADGYPIYAGGGERPSYRVRSGERGSGPGGVYDGTFVQDYEYVEGLGDLDACNGRFGETPEHGETYYYVITEAFPSVPRCLTASPDRSFASRGGRLGPGGPPPGR
jgi:hypothetical protein